MANEHEWKMLLENQTEFKHKTCDTCQKKTPSGNGLQSVTQTAKVSEVIKVLKVIIEWAG